MADNEQSESLQNEPGDDAPTVDDTPETDDAPAADETPETTDAPDADRGTTTESEPLDSTSVEETAETTDEADTKIHATFAGRNAVRAAGMVAGLGVFLLLGPVLFTGAGVTMWIQFGLATAIAVAGSLTAMKHGTDAVSAIGLPLLAAVMGALLVALPFILQVNSEALQWANVIAGGTVVVLALLAVFGFRKDAAARNGLGSATR